MRRTPLSFEVHKSLKMLMLTLCALLIGVTGFFFAHTTKTAESGSLIKENQTLKKQLEAENRTLKQQVIDAQSIYAIEDEARALQQPAGTYFVHPRRPLSRKELKKGT